MNQDFEGRVSFIWEGEGWLTVDNFFFLILQSGICSLAHQAQSGNFCTKSKA